MGNLCCCSQSKDKPITEPFRPLLQEQPLRHYETLHVNNYEEDHEEDEQGHQDSYKEEHEDKTETGVNKRPSKFKRLVVEHPYFYIVSDTTT